VLLKWNAQRGVPVIPKAASEAHLRENLEVGRSLPALVAAQRPAHLPLCWAVGGGPVRPGCLA
jgi:hypothetical protein